MKRKVGVDGLVFEIQPPDYRGFKCPTQHWDVAFGGQIWLFHGKNPLMQHLIYGQNISQMALIYNSF